MDAAIGCSLFLCCYGPNRKVSKTRGSLSCTPDCFVSLVGTVQHRVLSADVPEPWNEVVSGKTMHVMEAEEELGPGLLYVG